MPELELSCSCKSALVTLLLSVAADGGWAEVAELEAVELGTFCPETAESFELRKPETPFATCVASP